MIECFQLYIGSFHFPLGNVHLDSWAGFQVLYVERYSLVMDIPWLWSQPTKGDCGYPSKINVSWSVWKIIVLIIGSLQRFYPVKYAAFAYYDKFGSMLTVEELYKFSRFKRDRSDGSSFLCNARQQSSMLVMIKKLSCS